MTPNSSLPSAPNPSPMAESSLQALVATRRATVLGENVNEASHELADTAGVQIHEEFSHSHINNQQSGQSRDRPNDVKRLTDGGFVRFAQHSFITCGELSRLCSRDQAFLEDKGCLLVPSNPSLNSFLIAYFYYFHPVLPLLDEGQFWASASQKPSGEENGRIPLLLLQAMLFIACPYVSPMTLEILGFSSVREARSSFYAKAKTLFDFQIHKAKVTNAQAALMLTYHSSSTSDSINTQWLVTAINLAECAGADEYATKKADRCEELALKRLWWSCVMRDRIMALSFRRPFKIYTHSLEFDQPGLDEDDFSAEVQGTSVYAKVVKSALVQVSIKLCELALVLSPLLIVTNPDRKTIPVHFKVALRDAEICLASLNSWYRQTEETLATLVLLAPDGERPLMLFAKMFSIYYHSAKALIHHQLMIHFTTDSQDLTHATGGMKTRSEMRFSLQAVQVNFEALSQRGLVRYLPSTFVALSAFPLIWYSLDATMLEGESTQLASRHDLQTLSTVMSSFKNRYEVSDGVWRSVGQILSFALARVHSDESGIGPVQSVSRNRPRWEDLPRENPHTYLQLSLAIDYSIRFGRCPSETDLAEIFAPQKQKRVVISDAKPTDDDAHAVYMAFHTYVQQVEQDLLFA